MVPPRATMSSVSSTDSGVVRLRTRPRQPSMIPTQCPPALEIRRTTARITALSPGQSPPPVSRPTFIKQVRLRVPSGRHRGSRLALGSICLGNEHALNPRRVHPPVDEFLIAKCLAMQRNRRLDALDDQFIECPAHPGDGLKPG